MAPYSADEYYIYNLLTVNRQTERRKMKRNMFNQVAAGLVLATFFGGSITAIAASTTDQTVNITVDEIQEISTSGAATLHITTAEAGSAPTAVTDASTTYSITTNDGNVKIMAKLDTAMPDGMQLNLTAATSGTSAGKVTLVATDVAVVTTVTKVSETKMLTYELTATAAAGKLAATTRTVTFTITDVL